MTVRNLDKLLAPKSVALIGASPEPATVGAIVAANLLAGGFGGPVWLVNPHHKSINGVPCHRSIADLPGVPDLGVIATPRPVISVAFSGAGKKTVYVVGAGALGPDGKEFKTPEGVRNNAKTIFKIETLAQGFKGRAK